MYEKYPDTLYHYCPLESFLKIMKSSQIYLSDIRKSNDALEFKWILRKCKQLIDNKIITIIDEITFSHLNGHASKQQLEFRDQLHNILRDVEKVYQSLEENNTRTAWVVCFSGKPDSLDQWRGYANDGNGIALGFRREYLEIFNNIMLPPNAELTCALSPIKYDIGNKEYMRMLRISDININSDPINASAFFNASLTRACELPPVFKNPSFEEEQEWRVYFHTHISQNVLYNESAITTDPMIFQGRFEVKNRGFFVRENRIVSYIPLFMPTLKDAISKIIIGPKADITILDIKKILIQYGHYNQSDDCPIDIERSSSSYN